jgi:hypothetical protein
VAETKIDDSGIDRIIVLTDPEGQDFEADVIKD